MKLTNLEAKVFGALMVNYEGCPYGGWAQVYLDNARSTSGINGHQFAAILSSLKQKGLYRSQYDDAFGDVFVDASHYTYTEDEI